MDYLVAVDSCGELTPEMKADGHFVSIPLTIDVQGHHIVDDETFDQKDFLMRAARSPEPPKSACPSPELYRKAKREGWTKQRFLRAAAGIEGVYVPSLYDVSYCPDGRIEKITPRDGAPERVLKRIIQDLDGAAFPDSTSVRASHFCF